jgi:hypothetical protein
VASDRSQQKHPSLRRARRGGGGEGRGGGMSTTTTKRINQFDGYRSSEISLSFIFVRVTLAFLSFVSSSCPTPSTMRPLPDFLLSCSLPPSFNFPDLSLIEVIRLRYAAVSPYPEHNPLTFLSLILADYSLLQNRTDTRSWPSRYHLSSSPIASPSHAVS